MTQPPSDSDEPTPPTQNEPGPSEGGSGLPNDDSDQPTTHLGPPPAGAAPQQPPAPSGDAAATSSGSRRPPMQSNMDKIRGVEPGSSKASPPSSNEGEGEPTQPVASPEPEPKPANDSTRVMPETETRPGWPREPEPTQVRPESDWSHGSAAYAPQGSHAASEDASLVPGMTDADEEQRAPKPVRDRVWPHLIWELILLAGVAASMLWLWNRNNDVFQGANRDQLLLTAAILGGLAVAMAWSVRAGVPNLAVGPAAAAAGVIGGRLISENNWGVSSAATVMLCGALGAGIILGLVVVVLHVPSWVASLGLSALGLAIMLHLDYRLRAVVPRNIDLPDFTATAWIFAASVAVFSVLGGVLWSIHGVRWTFSSIRAERDPADRASVGGTFGAFGALVGSTVIAAGAGVLSLIVTREAAIGSALTYTALPLAIVLVGGVSIFGRRGGIFGTVFATAIVAVMSQVDYWQSAEGVLFMVGGGLLLGLIVTRFMEWVGRREPAREEVQPLGVDQLAESSDSYSGARPRTHHADWGA